MREEHYNECPMNEIFGPEDKPCTCPKNEEKKLTNGGKPHECGTIALHYSSYRGITLCGKCDMPVDYTPQIDIVASPRIDYCVDCDKEHGYDCPKQQIDTTKVTRVEVIDHTPADPVEGDFERGRVYVKWEDNIKVKAVFQDGNRTLKIFISNKD